MPVIETIADGVGVSRTPLWSDQMRAEKIAAESADDLPTAAELAAVDERRLARRAELKRRKWACKLAARRLAAMDARIAALEEGK